MLRECFSYNIFEFSEDAEELTENLSNYIDKILLQRKIPTMFSYVLVYSTFLLLWNLFDMPTLTQDK